MGMLSFLLPLILRHRRWELAAAVGEHELLGRGEATSGPCAGSRYFLGGFHRWTVGVGEWLPTPGFHAEILLYSKRDQWPAMHMSRQRVPPHAKASSPGFLPLHAFLSVVQ